MRLHSSIKDHCPLNLDFAVSVLYKTREIQKSQVEDKY